MRASEPEPPSLCHLAWRARDLARTRAFLTDLFGWRFEDQGDDYWVARPASGAWIGLAAAPDLTPGSSFLPQIAVADLDDCLVRARALGAPIVEEGEIPGLARFADLRDPDGALFSVLQFFRR